MNVISIPVIERSAPLICLDSAASRLDPQIKAEDTPEIPGKNKKLVCHVCQSPITDDSQRIQILGKNTHLRTNPAGFTYYFDCFGEASGCSVTGIPSIEHTWFIGYHWQISICKRCGEHLGWLFKGETRFFGLIQGRIVKAHD